MKILIILEYYPPHIGGAEIVFENLCKGLVDEGHECKVVTCRINGTEKYEERHGVKIYRVNVPRKGDRYWFTFLSLPKIWKLSGDADIIQTTTYNGAFPSILISKFRGKPSIITVHEVFGGMWKNLTGMSWFNAKVHQFLEKIIISLPFDKYICVSRYTRNCLRLFGVKDEKLSVTYNGIDYDKYNKKIDGKGVRKKLGIMENFVYMYYGRAGISKGVEYLIQAVPLISEKIPGSKLLLILAKDPIKGYEYILNLINTQGVKDEIILLEPVPSDELPKYIMSSDCVVVPSLTEGFGFTAAEACAIGKPIVATDVGSLPEVVSGKYILVEPRNPKAIAEGVEKIYKGEVENKCEKIFSWDECVEKYIEIYKEVLSK